MRVPTWIELLVLMVHGPVGPDGAPRPGPEPSVRGVLRSHRAGAERGNAVGWVVGGGDPVPVVAGAGRRDAAADEEVGLRVWRSGPGVRVEDLDGSPRVVADASTVWSFLDGGPVPVAAPRSALVLAGAGTHLLARREAAELVGDDYTRPTGPVGATTHAGRSAWTVELAPPPHKPHPMQVVVDAATGVVLQQRVDAVGAVDEWVEITVGGPADPSLFRWTGPTRAAPTAAEAAAPEHRAERERWATWFADAVGPVRREVVAPVLLDLSVQWVHTLDRRTGAFEATLGDGAVQCTLARRRRSSAPWRLGWERVQHRWTTDRFDWAFTAIDVHLTAEGLAAVERAFGEVSGPFPAARTAG